MSQQHEEMEQKLLDKIERYRHSAAVAEALRWGEEAVAERYKKMRAAEREYDEWMEDPR